MTDYDDKCCICRGGSLVRQDDDFYCRDCLALSSGARVHSNNTFHGYRNMRLCARCRIFDLLIYIPRFNKWVCKLCESDL
jgi:hypothetical protein